MSDPSAGNRVVYDTVNETVGERMSVYKDEKSGETVVPYSSGHEVTWQRTAVGDDGRLKEIRTVTKVRTPHGIWAQIRYRDDQYDRIFKKGRFAERKEETT